MTDKPVGRRHCQGVEQDKDHLRAPLATIVLSRVGLSGHLSRPPGLHGGVREPEEPLGAVEPGKVGSSTTGTST